MRKLKKPAEKGRRFGKVTWFAKKSLRVAGIAYLTAFLTMSTHVGYHYFRHRKPEIERGATINELQINRYKVNVNGKKKYLTLLGETHIYTKKEHEIAKKLVEEHKYLSCEVGNDFKEKISLGNYICEWTFSRIRHINFAYYKLGSGRWYKPLYQIAAENNRQISSLESPNDFWNNLSFKQKMVLLGEISIFLFTSPIEYYYAIGKAPVKEEYDMGELQEPMIDKRDKVMAKSIVELLEMEEIDKLLAEMGAAHLKGVTENLSQQVELEQIQE